MPETGIIVSAHGGRWNTQGRDLEIPAGSKVVYYSPDDHCISHEQGVEILKALEKGEKPTVPVNEIVAAGEFTYDYSCWYAEDWPDQ